MPGSTFPSVQGLKSVALYTPAESFLAATQARLESTRWASPTI